MASPIEHVVNRVARVRSLRATGQWLQRAIEEGAGGVAERFKLRGGWSAPHPGATGAAIPVLLELDQRVPELALREKALGLGRWLLTDQRMDGGWSAGTVDRPPQAKASLLETGRAVRGLLALRQSTGDGAWLEPARRAGAWALKMQAHDGLWSTGELAEGMTPSCFTEALADLLELSLQTRDLLLRDGVQRALARIQKRRDDLGAFLPWEHGERSGIAARAIAGSLLGLLDCACYLDAWDRVGAVALPALDRLARLAEDNKGRLPAAFDPGWKVLDPRTDPGANATLALALLAWGKHARDTRLLSTATMLLDAVCTAQTTRHPLAGARGAVSERLSTLGQALAPAGSTLSAVAHLAGLLALQACEQGLSESRSEQAA